VHFDKKLAFLQLSTFVTENIVIVLDSGIDIVTNDFKFLSFYRAMHFSAKRGIAIACRLSVRLSVCNVGEL